MSNDYKVLQAKISDEIMKDVLDFFDRKNLKLTKESLVSRYATYMTRDESDNTLCLTPAANGYGLTEDNMMAGAIRLGLYEALTTGIGPMIASKLANLFNQKHQSFSYLSENTEEVLSQYRQDNLLNALNIADYFSCAIDSCCIYITPGAEKLNYNVVQPHNVYILYNDMVIDRESGRQRPADQSDIDDAHAVIIRTGSTDKKNKYIAYFGESKMWPQGRMVSYVADTFDQVPPAGHKDIISEYVYNNSVANPYSIFNLLENLDLPVYPISIIQGGRGLSSNSLLSVSTQLFELSTEIDTIVSKIVSDGVDAVKNVIAIENPHAGMVPQISPSGIMILNQQQRATSLGGSPAIQQVFDSIKSYIQMIANNYNIPMYMLDTAAVPPSGVALQIQTQPLIDFRNWRISLNKKNVARIFEIEKMIINSFFEKNINPEEAQIWDAGQYVVAEDEAIKKDIVKDMEDRGYISHLEAIKKLHNLKTLEEAKEKHQQIQELNLEYAKPKGGAAAAQKVPFKFGG